MSLRPPRSSLAVHRRVRATPRPTQLTTSRRPTDKRILRVLFRSVDAQPLPSAEEYEANIDQRMRQELQSLLLDRNRCGRNLAPQRRDARPCRRCRRSVGLRPFVIPWRGERLGEAPRVQVAARRGSGGRGALSSWKLRGEHGGGGRGPEARLHAVDPLVQPGVVRRGQRAALHRSPPLLVTGLHGEGRGGRVARVDRELGRRWWWCVRVASPRLWGARRARHEPLRARRIARTALAKPWRPRRRAWDKAVRSRGRVRRTSWRTAPERERGAPSGDGSQGPTASTRPRADCLGGRRRRRTWMLAAGETRNAACRETHGVTARSSRLFVVWGVP